MKKDPPIIAERFFRWFCNYRHLEGLEGDLFELFETRVQEQGITRARLSYILDIVTLIRSSAAKPLPKFSTNNSMDIFFSNLKVAFRQGWKRKEFSLINLVGLVLGITSVLFISLYIHDELSFDSHISNSADKYRIYNIRYGGDGEINYLPIVPPSFAPSLKDNFPQIEKAGRILFDYGGTIFTVGDNSFSETDGFYAETSALEILDLKMLNNQPLQYSDRFSVLFSEHLFRKIFGDVPYNNQEVFIGTRTIKVAGVFKDLPDQSHIKAEYIFNFEYATGSITEDRMNSWGWQQFFTYIQLKPQTNVSEFELQVQNFVTEKSKPHIPQDFYYIPHFQNIRDIHLHSSNFEWEMAQRGNYQSILFLSFAAGIILLIACLNFINLTTAQALKRAKEVTVRKFVGAKRSQLLVQYSLESNLYTLLAGLVSLVILILLLPFFNNFTGKNFQIESIFIPSNIGIYVGGLLLIGIFAGLQPSILLTRFKPFDALHGLSNLRLRSSGISMRQFLVGSQYVLSIGLIIISLIIQRQYNFLQKTDMGFNKENLMVIPLTRSLRENLDATKSSFTAYANITNASFCYGVPGGIVAGDGVTLPSSDRNEESANMFIVDEDYISTMNMEIIAGRDFSHDIPSDLKEAFIVNETAVKNFGLKSPEDAIGQRVDWPYWGTNDSLKQGQIIGVVKDFNFKSLHNPISSLVMHMNPNYISYLILRIGKGDLPSTIHFIEEQYRKYEPKRPFNYEFVDQSFDTFYKSEQKLTVLFSIFTTLAIITAAIGLFGLVSHSVVSRAKEISIRKVLGAGVKTIFRLLVQRYFIMVLICLVIAVPASYYFAAKWLENFAYRVSIDMVLFLQVALLAVLLTLLTVGFQAIRGAMASPADKLRSE